MHCGRSCARRLMLVRAAADHEHGGWEADQSCRASDEAVVSIGFAEHRYRILGLLGCVASAIDVGSATNGSERPAALHRGRVSVVNRHPENA